MKHQWQGMKAALLVGLHGAACGNDASLERCKTPGMRRLTALGLAVALGGCGSRTGILPFEVSGSAPPVDASTGADAGSPCTLPSTIVTLASLPQNGGDLTGALALDSTYVYWTYDGTLGDTGGSVLRVPKCGGEVVTLATVASPFPYSGIAVDSTSVYWTNPAADATGSVVRVPIQGGASVTVEMGGDPIGVAVDSEYVYWADTQGDALFRVSKTGGAPTMLLTTRFGPQQVAVDATNLYWIDDGDQDGATPALFRAPKSGGQPTTLTTGAALYFLVAVDGTSVYTLAGDGTGAGSVVQIPIAGGTTITLGSGYPTGLAVDDASVYWTDDPSQSGMGPAGSATVLSVPKGGGVPTTIAANRMTPVGIAVDEARVYWTEQPSSPTPVPNVLSAPK